MVLLSALPTELLTLIFGYISADPEDFASFSAVSQRFGAIAYPFGKRHRELWRKYSLLEDRECSSPWFWHNVLQSVSHGWEGAKYVRRVKASYFEDLGTRNFNAYPEDWLIHEWDYEEHKEVLNPMPGHWSGGSMR